MATLLGVDGCRDGWVAAVDKGSGRPPTCHRFDSIAALLQRTPAASVVAIDIPIGLLEQGARDCDAKARQLLGRRRNSVFPAPIRATLQAKSYPEASALRFGVERKRMSLQAWGIIPKVAEVDRALRAHAAWRRRIREAHPEVCFFYLNSKRPMAHAKRRPGGREERLRLLRLPFDGAVDDALRDRKALGCAEDDVIDAFVCLWTARRIVSGAAIRIPQHPAVDAFGISMEIMA